MYERFTDRARKVMQLAKQEAARLNTDLVGTEHVLLGLLKEGSGVAAHALKAMGVDLPRLLAAAEESAALALKSAGPRGPEFSEFVLAALAGAKDEANMLGHGYVGTEHILLALLKTENRANVVLVEMGVTPASVRAAVFDLLGDEVLKAAGAAAGAIVSPDVKLAKAVWERASAALAAATEVEQEARQALTAALAAAAEPQFSLAE